MREKIVLLDRDGVINKFPGKGNYVLSWQEFSFLPGVFGALTKLKKAGYKVFIVSNQACVSKGFISKESLLGITDNMLKELKAQGILIDGVYYCIHQDSDNCPFRKPNPGLVNQIFKDLGLEDSAKEGVFFIGDSIRDIQTAKNSGVKSLLVLSGQEDLANKSNWALQPDSIAEDLGQAVEYILNYA